jgi:hypothetical protein
MRSELEVFSKHGRGARQQKSAVKQHKGFWIVSGDFVSEKKYTMEQIIDFSQIKEVHDRIVLNK